MLGTSLSKAPLRKISVSRDIGIKRVGIQKSVLGPVTLALPSLFCHSETASSHCSANTSILLWQPADIGYPRVIESEDCLGRRSEDVYPPHDEDDIGTLRRQHPTHEHISPSIHPYPTSSPLTHTLLAPPFLPKQLSLPSTAPTLAPSPPTPKPPRILCPPLHWLSGHTSRRSNPLSAGPVGPPTNFLLPSRSRWRASAAGNSASPQRPRKVR